MGKPGLGMPVWGSKHLRPRWRSRRRRGRIRPLIHFSDVIRKKKIRRLYIVDGSGRTNTCMLIRVSGCCTTDNFEVLRFCFYTWCGAFLSTDRPFLFQVMHDGVVEAYIFARIKLYTHRRGYNFCLS
jgi:hypothetical protein